MSRVYLIISVVTALVALLGGVQWLVGEYRAWLWRRKQTGKWLVIVMVLLAPALADAACDETTVQNQINAASNGDTVTITPASCSASWSDLSISGKYITLDGNGATISQSGSTNTIDITVNSGGLTRLTNFTLTSAASAFSPNAIIGVEGCTYNAGSPNASFRIDNITFSGNGITHIYIGCHGRGLIDHNTFSVGGGNEVIQNFGPGDGSATGWTDDVTAGSVDAVYVEDNTFDGTGGADKTAQFYGSRMVYRFNTLDCVQFDVHGNRPRSGRWWEAYHNTHLRVSCSASYNNRWYQIRGGSGFIFNNTMTADADDNIYFWQDGTSPGPGHPSGGPRNVSGGQDHVGSGKNQVQTPAYVWGNTSLNQINVDQSDAGSCGDCIQADRDYFAQGGSFDGTSGVGVGTLASRPSTCSLGSGGDAGVGYWATDQGGNWNTTGGSSNDGAFYQCTSTDTWTLAYTPYTYPHPLQGGGGGESPASHLFQSAQIVRWLELASIISLGWHWRGVLAGAVMLVIGHSATVSRAIVDGTKTTSIAIIKTFVRH